MQRLSLISFSSWSSRVTRGIFCATLVIFLLTPFFLSAFLRVDYYDSYDYLRNALSLLQKNVGFDGYVSSRPVLLPLIESLLLVAFPPPEQMRQLICAVHMLASLIFLLTICSFFFVVKKIANRKTAFLASLFLASNALLVHFAPMGCVDILSSFFFILATYFFYKILASSDATFSVWNLAAMLLLLFLAACCKFYFALYGVIFSVWILVYKRKHVIPVVLLNILFPVLLLAVHLLPLYILKRPAPLKFFLATIFRLSSYSLPMQNESPWNYLFSFVSSVKIAGVIFFVSGLLSLMICRFRKSDRNILIVGICLLIPLICFRHYESRYLIPVMPFVAYFCARGGLLLQTVIRMRLRKSRARKIARPLFIFFLLSSVCYSWASEVLKFRDPVYWTPMQERFAKTVVSENLNGNPSLWFNNFYALSPDNPRLQQFSRADNFMYLFHTSSNTIYALSATPCLYVRSSFFHGTLLPTNTELPIQDGTIFFLSPYLDREFNETHPFNKRPLPFIGKFRCSRIPLESLLIRYSLELEPFGKILGKREGGRILISISGSPGPYRVRVVGRQQEAVFTLDAGEWKSLPDWAIQNPHESQLEIITIKKIA